MDRGKQDDWIAIPHHSRGKTISLTLSLFIYSLVQDKAYYKKTMLDRGLTASLYWYMVLVEKYNQDDDARGHQSFRLIEHLTVMLFSEVTTYNLKQPILFVACNKEPIALPIFGTESHREFAKGRVTNKKVDGDHRAAMSRAEEPNQLLSHWIENLKV